VLADPATFAAGDVVPGWATKVPGQVMKAAQPLVPTFLWVATLHPSQPRGGATRVAPRPVSIPG
jgi:hypothetical protein